MVECSIALQQSGKKSDQIAQTVTSVLTKGHFQLILRIESAFLKDIYAGVKLLSALYAKTALLYINRFGIYSQLNCSNI